MTDLLKELKEYFTQKSEQWLSMDQKIGTYGGVNIDNVLSSQKA